MKKLLAVGVILLFIGMSIPSTGTTIDKSSPILFDGNTLYVGGDGPGNYTRIQDAIVISNFGDVACIFNGIGMGNVENAMENNPMLLKFDDLNNDEIPEILVQLSENQVYVLNVDGSFSNLLTLEGYEKFLDNPLFTLEMLQQPGVPEIQPGWPKSVGRSVYSSPALSDLAGDSNLEIIIGCSDNKVYIWGAYGVSISNWPQTTGGEVKSSPALGNIDDDDELEIIVGSWDHKIYAWNIDGTLVDGLWPKITTGVIISSPTLGDIDQDNELEIVIACYYGASATLYALNGDGSDVDGWPRSFSESIECTAALGDIDGDGRLEVVIGTSGSATGKVYAFNGEDATIVDGWPVEINGGIRSSPALGDIDNNGDLEIVLGTSWWGGYVWVFNGNGSVVEGWPKDVSNNVIASPALADFDDDGDLEIVVPTSIYVGSPVPARMFIWHDNGQVVDNWPVAFSDPYQRIVSSPLVCDIDDDSELEIVVGSADGGAAPSPNLYAFNYDASLVNDAWPLYGEDIYSSPAAGEIDDDGMLEIVVGSWHDYKVHCWELGENTYDPTRLPWPMFHHDRWHTGLYNDGMPPLVKIIKPENALYIRNKKILPLRKPLIIGYIDIEIEATDEHSGINQIEFYINNKLKSNCTEAPYSWRWDEHTPFRFRHTIKVIAYDNAGNNATKEMKVWKFF
ncbi:MAG: VCBS repeat-containing protein [Thermoplasmatales archaeon]|nr:MAG: VCBS repeat-containing protein [Thermoplasmatales archaeon]